MNLIAGALFAALTLASGTAPDASMMQPIERWIAPYNAAGPLSVQLHQERGVLLLDARLNGSEPMLFVLDPGESDLYTRYARAELHGRKAQTVCVSSACYPTSMQFLDGDSNQIDPKHDTSLGPIAGSIGPELLQRYVVQIDYRASSLTLIPPAQFHPPSGTRPLPLRVDANGVPAVSGAIDETRGDLELDVRAPTSLLFTPFLDRTGLRSKYPGKPHIVHTVRIGSTVLHGMPFSFSTASGGKFASTDVAGLLGNNILSHCVITFDLPHHGAYLSACRD